MDSRRINTFVATDQTAGLDAAALADRLGEAGVEFGPGANSIRSVLDTFDGRLHRAGVRCETRAPRPSGPFVIVVTEGERVHAPEPVASWVPSVDARGGPGADLLAGLLRDRTLEARATVVAPVREGPVLDADGEPVGFVTMFGTGRAVGGPFKASRTGWQPTPVVVEVTTWGARRRSMKPVVEAVRAASLVPIDGDRMDHAMRQCGVDPGGLVTAPSVALTPDLPGPEAVRRVLAHLAGTIEATWAGTAADRDIEYLHEFRIAVRRSRTVLGACRSLVPAALAESGRSTFGVLGELTGPARDLDVTVSQWSRLTAALDDEQRASLEPLLAELVERRRDAHQRLSVGLRARSTRQAVDRWGTHLSGPFVAIETESADREIERRIRRAHRRLVSHGRSIGPDAPAEQLHALRKDAKRVRYLVECFATLLGPKSRRAYLSRLRQVQANLGEFQDRDVQARMIRDLAETLDARVTPVATLLSSGYLIAVLDERRNSARAGFAACFAAFDTDATHAMVERMVSR